MAVKPPAIPSVPSSDPATYAFNLALKEQLELLTGTRNNNDATLSAATQAAITAAANIAVSNPTYTISLTNVATTVQADASGIVSSFATANGNLHVFANGFDITGMCVLSLVSQTGCTGQLNTAVNTPISGQPMGYYEVIAMSSNIGSVLMQAQFEAVTLQATFNISKALAGAVGGAGTGTGALSLQLSSVALVLPAYANQTVQSFGTATGVAKMFNGTTDVTASATFSGIANNCTATINTAANTPVAGQPIGYYQFTAMTQPTATYLISGTYSGTTISQMVNLTMAIGGYEIVSALPNTNLFQGRIVFYTVDNKLYRYDGAEWVTWVQASDVTGQINAAQIQDGVITTAKLLPGLSPVILETSLPTPGIAGRIVYLTADSQLYRDTGTAWTLAVPAVNVTGSLVGSQIAVAAIATSKLVVATTGGALNGDPGFTDPTAWTYNAYPVQFITVPDGMVGNNAIQSDGLAADNYIVSTLFNVSPLKSYRVACWIRCVAGGPGNLFMRMRTYNNVGGLIGYSTGYEDISVPQSATWVQLVGAVTPPPGALTGQISLDFGAGPPNGALIQAQDFRCMEMVASDLIVPNSITTNMIQANTITAAMITAGAVTTGSMIANSITGDRIQAGTLSASKIIANSIGTAQLAANSITAGQIQAGAITTNAMIANSITGDRIQAGTLAASKIAANSITGAQIAANTITALNIYAGTITADKIQAGAITAAQIASTTITAIQIAVGTLTSAQIQAGSITASSLQANSITAAQLASSTLITASAQIGNLVVGTSNIATGAVTNSTYGFLASQTFSQLDGTYVGLTLNVTTSGGKCLIWMDSDTTTAGFYITATGFQRNGATCSLQAGVMDSPPAGLNTYRLTFTCTGAINGGTTALNQSILVLELKK